MRIALLQEERHLPSFGGGNKSSRLLLEALAAHGHDCLMLCPACPKAVAPGDFRAAMRRREIAILEPEPGRFEYTHRGVRIVGMPRDVLDDRRTFLVGALKDFCPDVVVVSADPRYYLLEGAL